MGFLDTIKDRLHVAPASNDDYYDDGADDGYDPYYDDYQDDQPVARDRRGRRDDSDSSGSVLGNASRPEAESISVFTRSGRPVDDDPYAPTPTDDYRAPADDSSWRLPREDRYDRMDGRTTEFAAQRPQMSPMRPVEADPSVVAPHVTTPGDVGLTAHPRVTSGQLPPYVLKPTAYDDVQMVVRRVRTNQPVVLSFKMLKIDTAMRILDFCFGLACGLGGSVRDLGDRVFVVLPAGIELSQADLDKLAQDGVIGR